MRYAYYPGCSASRGGAEAYGQSTLAVSRALDLELTEIEDWNCCGSTPYSSVDELISSCMSARNLALAEKMGLDLVTACSSCYCTLRRANSMLQHHSQLQRDVQEALAAGGLEYHGKVQVRHLAEVILNDVGREAIAEKVRRDLTGLKVAVYYGCQIVRPGPGFDDPEFPQSLDRLTESLGAKVVPFPLKTRCCGGSLIIPEESVALGLIHKLLDSAAAHGAECIITVCPLCQTNLDVYQGRVNKKFKTHYDIPVLFFTQLVGLALGLSGRELGIDKGIVSAKRLVSKYK